MVIIGSRVGALLAFAALLGGTAHGQWPTNKDRVEEVLETAEAVIGGGPFQANWESLKAYQAPDWYLDGKLGIFVHWGVFSVPAFGDESYSREMYREGSDTFEHHRKTYGPQAEFGYKDFIPEFKTENFDPARWAGLFEMAGARFVVAVAEHRDGFAMYDSEFSEWCATAKGPERDLLGELAAAVRAKGLIFGLSTHRAEHWWNFDGGREFDSDVTDSEYADLYAPAQPAPRDLRDPNSRNFPDQPFLDDWLARTCDLVDAYRPQLVWFDAWIEHQAFQPFNQRFGAFYYNRAVEWKKGVVINYQHGAFQEGAAVLDIDHAQVRGIRRDFWQASMPISRTSRGYVKDDQYRDADSVIDALVDIVSRNGALLLGIAPRPDGTISRGESSVLTAIGRWMKVNGEAIHGTRPWHTFGEGPAALGGSPFTGQDIRFTTKDNTLYAICLAWPGEKLVIRSLSWKQKLWFGDITKVELLGKGGTLPWERDANGMTVRLPAGSPGKFAFVLKISGP
jgi:alpha-L-fucosidase